MKIVVRRGEPQHYFTQKSKKYEYIDLYLDFFHGLTSGSMKYWVSFRNIDEDYGNTWHFKMTVGPYLNYYKQKLPGTVAVQIAYFRAI